MNNQRHHCSGFKLYKLKVIYLAFLGIFLILPVIHKTFAMEENEEIERLEVPRDTARLRHNMNQNLQNQKRFDCSARFIMVFGQFSNYYNGQLEISNEQKIVVINTLIQILLGYTYLRCNNVIKYDENIIIESIRENYLASPALRKANPLVEWIFNVIIVSQSKAQVIEGIIEYLNADNEKNYSLILENLHKFLLQKDFLEDFKLNFHQLRKKFSFISLEKLKNIFRYIYAKKIKEEMFYGCNNTLYDIIHLSTKKNKLKYIDDLNKIRNSVLKYCQHSSIESPFLSAILENHQFSNTEKILRLAGLYHKAYQENSSLLVSEKEIIKILEIHMENIFKLIKDITAHLDYIVDQKGIYLDSNTQFGVNKCKDILSFLN